MSNPYTTIEANASLIWTKEGPTPDFDIDLDTDDYLKYHASLSIIRPNTKGQLSRIPLMMSTLHNSKERALRELDNTLKDMVRRGVKKEVQPHELEEFDITKALKLIDDIKAGRL